MRLYYDFRPLCLFRAVICQSHFRILYMFCVFHISRAHNPKLFEHFRTTLGVRPGVYYHCFSVFSRQNRSQSGSCNSRYPFDYKRSPGEQGSRVPGGDRRVALTVFQQGKSHSH